LPTTHSSTPFHTKTELTPPVEDATWTGVPRTPPGPPTSAIQLTVPPDDAAVFSEKKWPADGAPTAAAVDAARK
jgi:hypothetical protein